MAEVLHDRDKHKFFIEVNGKECHLLYRYLGNDVLEYFATFTPQELRGHGLAAQVTKYALDYAEENNFKVKPTCSYVKEFIEKNPRYKDLVNL